MHQIHVPLGGPAHDNNPPINRRIVASSFAHERKKIVCGRNPVEQDLTLTVRDRPRGKRHQHIFEVVMHLREPIVASARLPVGCVAIEPVGRRAHPLEQIAQGSNRDTKSELLGHRRGHGVIGQVFLAKFLKEICVLAVPASGSWHSTEDKSPGRCPQGRRRQTGAYSRERRNYL
jgi:hypothetical protein